jgi:type III secretion system FlhB-like substrate exporter
MFIINTSTISQLPKTAPHKIETSAKSNDAESTQGTSATQGTEPQISGQAKILSALYETASAYVMQEHLEPFAGYIKGNVTPGAYIDVGKYNDYLFDKAASTLVDHAKEQGISLDKKDIIAQLKSDHSDIAEMELNDQDRRSKLGSSSMYAKLSIADINNLTDTYITAKENGLSLDQVHILATKRGIQNHYGSTLQEADIYPYNWDFSEADPNKIASAKNQLPESILNKANEINGKLQGDSGLGSDFIKFLLNPKIGLRGATDASLDFLSRLIDIQNQQNKQLP